MPADSASPSFQAKVLQVVRTIPQGRMMTYKEVAKQAGNGRAARAVGMFMSRNFDPSVPCHRVIRSDGKMGGYNRGGIHEKMRILKEEAVGINSIFETLSMTKIPHGWGTEVR